MSASTTSSERFSRSGGTTGRRLELWIRSSTIGEDGVGHLIEQARALGRIGAVDAVEVRTWDDAVDLSSTPRSHREREARARLQQFKRWAWQHGTELVGFGERRRAARGRMGPEYVTQRVPPVLLAEYEDDVLMNVTPCRDSERCVSERLDALESEAETVQYSTERSRIVR
ncbi:HTH domain-containing protein [Salinigranum sp. GCM10025319]|uniref:HTH domain-containing protein n=1 Tax=Salinigranum sp. GCM10025319 TaxID=3252687 RepID=UPI00360A1C3C